MRALQQLLSQLNGRRASPDSETRHGVDSKFQEPLSPDHAPDHAAMQRDCASSSISVPPAEGWHSISAWKTASEQVHLVGNARWGELAPSTRSMAAIGECIWQWRSEVQGKTLHIAHDNRLIAVLDPARMQVAVRNRFEPVDANDLTATLKPQASAAVPSGFSVQSVWDVMWQFGMHNPRAGVLTPEKIGQGMLRLQHLPRVSAGLIDASVMATIGAMLAGPVHFDTLCRSVSAAPREVCQHIAAMYVTRAVVLM